MFFKKKEKSSDPDPSEVKKLNEELEKRHYEFQANCDNGNGDPMACHSYGEWVALIDKNYEKAAKIYEENCEKFNYPASCFNLGRHYLAGKGVIQNNSLAAKCFEKACENNFSMGCHHLGIMCLTGDGVEKNTEKAINCLKKACDQNEENSCFRLASLYLTKEKKNNIERDVEKARNYLEKACDNNFAPACNNLAVMYNYGDGSIQKDENLYKKYSEKTILLVEQARGSFTGVKKK